MLRCLIVSKFRSFLGFSQNLASIFCAHFAAWVVVIHHVHQVFFGFNATSIFDGWR